MSMEDIASYIILELDYLGIKVEVCNDCGRVYGEGYKRLKVVGNDNLIPVKGTDSIGCPYLYINPLRIPEPFTRETIHAIALLAARYF